LRPAVWRALVAAFAAVATLSGCGGSDRSDPGAGTATAEGPPAASERARRDPFEGVRAPADVCRRLSARRLRAVLLDPDLLPSRERRGYRLALAERRLRVEGRSAPACAYGLRRAGTGFEFLVVLVARGGDQEGLRERLREGGGEDAVEVDVAGRSSSYAVGDRKTTRTQLAVPAGDATLIVRPGITLGIDPARADRFNPDRRRDNAANIARAMLGAPFIGGATLP